MYNIYLRDMSKCMSYLFHNFNSQYYLLYLYCLVFFQYLIAGNIFKVDRNFSLKLQLKYPFQKRVKLFLISFLSVYLPSSFTTSFGGKFVCAMA